jgi:hypothetical protein
MNPNVVFIFVSVCGGEDENAAGAGDLNIIQSLFYPFSKDVFECRPLFLFQFVEGKMKMLLGLGDTVQSLSALVGIALGFIMMIPEVTLWIRQEDLTSQNRGFSKIVFLALKRNKK